MLINNGQPMAALKDLYAVRNTSLSRFTKDVAACVFDACDQALRDAQSNTSRMIVVPAPTGGGKSSAATAYLAALVRDTDLNAALICDTQSQCDAAYREFRELLREPGQVAVWTQSHDAEKCLRSDDEIEIEQGFRPAARFTKQDLSEARIAIGTHAFYKGKNSRYISDNRTLIIIDEKPNDVILADISVGDVVQVHDGVVSKMGTAHPTARALKDLSNSLQALWDGKGLDARLLFEAVGGQRSFMDHNNLRHLVRIHDWGDLEMRKLISDTASLPLVQNVCRFAKAASLGHAFMARYVQAQPKGGRFVGYLYDFPIKPGMVLLDATADLDGVDQLVTWRATAPRMPRVNFQNLEVQLVSPCVPIRKKRVREILSTPDYVDAWRSWAVSFVLQETAIDEDILLVVHKDLKAHLPRLESEEWQGRNVHLCHWGAGIGSNKWKHCSAVFMFGEFHQPKRSTVATALGLEDVHPTSARLRDAQNVKGLRGNFLTLQEGHLLRWTKQLACRGNVRNIDDDGNCGTMRLYLTGEFGRLLDNKDRLFPGCRISTGQSSPDTLKDKSGKFIDRLRRYLLEQMRTTVPAADVDEALGTRTRRYQRELSSPKGSELLAAIGWRYQPGRRGKGCSATFVRLSSEEVTGRMRAA